MSRDLISEMNKVLKNDIVNRMSFFQLQYFIINKEPTMQAKMWQCIREIRTRKDTLESLQREIAESEDQKELLEIELRRQKVAEDKIKEAMKSYSEEERKLNLEEAAVKARKLNRHVAAVESSIAELQKRVQETSEEAQWFLRTFEELQKLEPLKPFDDIESQKQYWDERLRHDMNLRLLLHHPIDVELAKTILSLYDEAPIKRELVNMIEKVQLIQMQEDQKLKKSLQKHDKKSLQKHDK